MWDMVSYILALPPPQILHLLARFGKGIPEGTQCRLVVLAIELGGRWSPEAAHFIRSLAHTKPRATPPHPISDKPPSQPSWHDGRFPSPMLLCMPMPHPCYPCRVKEPSQGKTPPRSLENF